jgi:hypothetical protein
MSALSMWVIYDHTTDFPDHWVARRWIITREGEGPTEDIMVASDSLETLRGLMVENGLTCLTRAPEDDRKIVEVWL